jgi:hypothetical protein
MERARLPSVPDDDMDDIPTVPGICIWPEWARDPDLEPSHGAVLEDPESWDTEEDTQRFRQIA